MASRTRWWGLAALALSMLTIGLDTTVLSVALPTLAADLAASTAQLQWFSTYYTLVLAALLLPAGALGDRYGYKRLRCARCWSSAPRRHGVRTRAVPEC